MFSNTHHSQSKKRTKKFSMKVYIGSINPHITSGQLMSYFKEQGLQVKFLTKKGNRTKNYVIAKAKNKHTYDFLTAKKKKHEIEGFKFTTDVLLTGEQKLIRDQEIAKKKIYVGNLPDNISDEDLKMYFEGFGEVDTAYVSRKNMSSNCFGFVIFRDERISQSLIETDYLFMEKQKLLIKRFKPKWSKNVEKTIQKKKESVFSTKIDAKGVSPVHIHEVDPQKEIVLKNYRTERRTDVKEMKDLERLSEFPTQKDLLEYIDQKHRYSEANLNLRFN